MVYYVENDLIVEQGTGRKFTFAEFGSLHTEFEDVVDILRQCRLSEEYENSCEALQILDRVKDHRRDI